MSIENENQILSSNLLKEHLISARRIVDKWPDWKKNLLQQTNNGTSFTPRTTEKDSNKQVSN